LGKADGSFGAITSYATSVVPNRLLFKDLDKNGVEDLVAFNTAGSQIDPNNGNLLSTTKVIGKVGGDDDLVRDLQVNKIPIK
jgi:hypothetical protein